LVEKINHQLLKKNCILGQIRIAVRFFGSSGNRRKMRRKTTHSINWSHGRKLMEVFPRPSLFKKRNLQKTKRPDLEKDPFLLSRAGTFCMPLMFMQVYNSNT
jgi:hypothetical protein